MCKDAGVHRALFHQEKDFSTEPTAQQWRISKKDVNCNNIFWSFADGASNVPVTRMSLGRSG
jgi:hypothetical protein